MNTLKYTDNESTFSLRDFCSSVFSMKWASFLIISLLSWCNSWPSENCDNMWNDVQSLAETVVKRVDASFYTKKWFSWDFQVNVNWEWGFEITNNVSSDELDKANAFLKEKFDATDTFINNSWNWISENWKIEKVWNDYFLESHWNKSYVCKKK